MNRRGFVASLAIALLAAACGDPELKAHLEDGSGLKAGAKVFVNGVEVGKVKDIAVAGDAVEVTFTVESKHHLAPHADACAYALPVRDEGTLYVRLGSQGELAKGAALPQCHLVGDAIRSAVKEVGGAITDAIDRLTSNKPAPAGVGPCTQLSAKIMSLRKPDGVDLGTRVQLELSNDSDTRVTLPMVTSARLIEEHKVELPITASGEGSLWMMPFAIQPHSKKSVGVVINEADAKPKWFEADIGYGFFDSCHVSLELKGP
jgi:hypothetical protein